MYKRLLVVAIALLAVLVGTTAAFAGGGGPKNACTTIQSGELYSSDGDPIVLGYDQFGYNYQAHMFNGRYCDYDRHIGGEYCDVELVMKWNDAWLSNMDCGIDGVSGLPDGKLDRHYGFPSYIGSGAWTTNHMRGEYEQDGKTCEWTYFTKIIAAPADATKVDGVWYNADGVEIGPDIWGEFATIQEVYNDPCAGYNGLVYLSPDHAGFGGW
jgi:hypothetical protein